MDRIVLNASLDGIAEGRNVDENVKNAAGVLMNLSNLADNTLFYMRDRPNSDFLRSQLSYDDLEKVGNYRCKRSKENVCNFRT